jgi:hypothetical protein
MAKTGQEGNIAILISGDEENNQQNALINSSINLLMSDHSNMFRLPS